MTDYETAEMNDTVISKNEETKVIVETNQVEQLLASYAQMSLEDRNELIQKLSEIKEKDEKDLKERKKQELQEKIDSLNEQIKPLTDQLNEKKKELAELNGKTAGKKNRDYKEFRNPNNPLEVYRTGIYRDWLKDLAKENGIDPLNKKAMKKWIKSKMV